MSSVITPSQMPGHQAPTEGRSYVASLGSPTGSAHLKVRGTEPQTSRLHGEDAILSKVTSQMWPLRCKVAKCMVIKISFLSR